MTSTKVFASKVDFSGNNMQHFTDVINGWNIDGRLPYIIIIIISPYSVAFGVILSLLFFCTVEDISTQDGAIGVKFWLRVERTPETGTR